MLSRAHAATRHFIFTHAAENITFRISKSSTAFQKTGCQKRAANSATPLQTALTCARPLPMSPRSYYSYRIFQANEKCHCQHTQKHLLFCPRKSYHSCHCTLNHQKIKLTCWYMKANLSCPVFLEQKPETTMGNYPN